MISLVSTESVAQVSPSEFEYPYNHLDWYTIEGEYFMVHYQEGSETTAGAVSVIAHQIYTPITDLYDFEPERKVSIILRDRADYSNGAAYFFDDKIDIWIPPLDTPLRGTHQWLRNVITHEFTHIVQMGASMKRSPKIQSIYFQWLSYEDVRRPDVLYGSPKGVVSLPFSSVSIPAWFSEGVAQFMRDSIFYDYWDSHRDMILRMAILNENALEFSEMGDFSSKTSLEREMVYNQGFDFIRYLADRFGEQVIKDLAKASAQGENNFSSVMQAVTGHSGKELFNEWIENRRTTYSDQINKIDPIETKSIEENGFLNFYPQFSQQGSIFGYLTNRGRDYGTTQLIIKTPDSTLTVDELNKPVLDNPDQDQSSSIIHDSKLAIDFVGNRFSFSPNGEQISYSKAETNKYGEEYQDIYVFDLREKETKKITTDGRIQDPAWHPQKNQVVAVELKNGTQNLVLLNLDSVEQEQLTHFQNGETIYTPVWSPDGRQIYFASADINNRNLYAFDLESGAFSPVLESNLVDFRDPWVDASGNYLYFSSDADGIFNIYRQHIESKSIQKVTDVQGGAFTPFAKKDSLYFSHYKSDGYKISATLLPDFIETHQAEELIKSTINQNKKFVVSDSQPNQSVYQNIVGLSALHDSLKVVNTESEIQVSKDSNENTTFSWRPYSQTTTGLSIIPVIRFDNYSKLKGSNSGLIKNGKFGNLGKNLVRDFKAGAYFTSRDVTERLSLFAGAMFGLGSLEADSFTDFFSPNRLNNLDRDLFFIVDHRGIPFIKRSWSPTVSIEIYNLKRNVRDGASIEEFPCTSCFPTQKSVDVRYDVWEANLFLRSKLNRWSLLQLGASYSPYSVSTDGFFSDEFQEFIPGSTTEYFKGSSLSLSYITNTVTPSRHSDIAPEGARASISFMLDNGRLLQDFEIDEGTLSPVYANTTNYSLELKNQIGGAISEKLNMMLTGRVFSYFTDPEDYFYLDYAGGLSGMRSYPYFAVGGQRTAWGRLSFLTPLKRNINKQIGAYTFDKVYSHLFFEIGNGWGGPLSLGKNLKTGVGAELRLALNSYYLFPLKFFINTTYGFNQFNVTLPDQFVTTSSRDNVTYGKELLFYFGLTFDFSQL